MGDITGADSKGNYWILKILTTKTQLEAKHVSFTLYMCQNVKPKYNTKTIVSFCLVNKEMKYTFWRPVSSLFLIQDSAMAASVLARTLPYFTRICLWGSIDIEELNGIIELPPSHITSAASYNKIPILKSLGAHFEIDRKFMTMWKVYCLSSYTGISALKECAPVSSRSSFIRCSQQTSMSSRSYRTTCSANWFIPVNSCIPCW